MNLEKQSKNGKVTQWMLLIFTRPFIVCLQNLTSSNLNTLKQILYHFIFFLFYAISVLLWLLYIYSQNTRCLLWIGDTKLISDSKFWLGFESISEGLIWWEDQGHTASELLPWDLIILIFAFPAIWNKLQSSSRTPCG